MKQSSEKLVESQENPLHSFARLAFSSPERTSCARNGFSAWKRTKGDEKSSRRPCGSAPSTSRVAYASWRQPQVVQKRRFTPGSLSRMS